MIVWNPSEVAITIGGFELRWYAVFWCLGLAAAYYIVHYLYRRQGISQEKFDPLFLYCFVGILVGARLGHCLLYEPGYYLSHPIEMFLPIREEAEGWTCTGYAGLASHGGTLGLILALWLYVRKTGVNILRVVDNIAVATPLTACCIRLGNLMNSEIVGKYTGTDWGFVFANNWDRVNHCVENMPRHPAQLYEATAYLLFFLIGLLLYRKYKHRIGTGFFFGYCLTSIFTFRLIVEYCKEVQEPWEQTMRATIGLDQGQLLSLPFIAIGLYCLLGGKWCRRLGEKSADGTDK
ncbi:MAG: prolipoprotein diacylglyceryl transferase [Bacteroidales bacterium]|nr:prolipoprotein diacylglyceryl transferase [Bacteroidales bacterium]